jgi:hypothetical protein
MKQINKVSVMARFATTHHQWSEYGHIVISFSLVSAANGYDTPAFVSWDHDMPKALLGMNNLLINTQVGAEDIKEKGLINAHYGYEIALDFNQPALNTELEQAMRAGKKIQKRIATLCDNEGYCNNLVDYLRYVFRAMNVQYITHESYSDKHYQQKWKGYKMADLPCIVERCTEELIEQLRWPLPMADAS